MIQSNRGQTNIDFAIALLILLVFLTSTIVVTGSPIFGADRSDIDYNNNAQQMIVELEHDLLDSTDGQTPNESINDLIQEDNPSEFVTLPDGTDANIIIEPAGRVNQDLYENDEFLHNGLFDADDDRIVVGEEPTETVLNAETVVSSASTVIEVDNREVRITLQIWRDT